MTPLEEARQRLAEATHEAQHLMFTRIQELTLEGKTIEQIVQTLGVSTRQVWKARQRLDTTSPNNPTPKVDPQKLRELIAAGKTRPELAAYFGCSLDAISRARKRAGLPPDTRHHGRPAIINRNEVRRLTEAGHTASQIAETLKCSKQGVERVRHELGIKGKYQQLPPEKRERIEAAIRDGWSQAEICRTLNVDVETMRRHYPDAKWGPEQIADYVRTLRTATRFNWGHHKPEANAA